MTGSTARAAAGRTRCYSAALVWAHPEGCEPGTPEWIDDADDTVADHTTLQQAEHKQPPQQEQHQQILLQHGQAMEAFQFWQQQQASAYSYPPGALPAGFAPPGADLVRGVDFGQPFVTPPLPDFGYAPVLPAVEPQYAPVQAAFAPVHPAAAVAPMMTMVMPQPQAYYTYEHMVPPHAYASISAPVPEYVRGDTCRTRWNEPVTLGGPVELQQAPRHGPPLESVYPPGIVPMPHMHPPDALKMPRDAGEGATSSRRPANTKACYPRDAVLTAGGGTHYARPPGRAPRGKEWNSSKGGSACDAAYCANSRHSSVLRALPISLLPLHVACDCACSARCLQAYGNGSSSRQTH